MEIKDDIRNKNIDKTMTVSEKGEHFQNEIYDAYMVADFWCRAVKRVSCKNSFECWLRYCCFVE